jgi:superfamily II DNA or RNA helicase
MNNVRVIMAEVITVEQLDAINLKVTADPGVRQEIAEFFSFRPANYQFTPAYKNKIWDGYIRLYAPMRPVLLVGLIKKLIRFCDDRGYQMDAPDHLIHGEDIAEDYGYTIAKEVNCKYEPRPYQNKYIVDALRDSRSLNLSPTSSGKSLIIYLMQQHYYRKFNHRTLIIVPTISLVHQMEGDFVDYGCDPEAIYKIQGGVDKTTDKPIVVSTWQSLAKLPKQWFDQFKVVLGDEAHLFQAKSLQKIMGNLPECYYRHGFTGTLKTEESKTHQLVLEGCFGSVRQHVTTKDLIDDGTVADFDVKAIVLSHPTDIRKGFKKAINKLENSKKFSAEREFLVNCEKRNIFLRNLLWSLEGQNNLVLFDLVEKHGKLLEPLFEKEGRELHFIHGKVKGEERERIRHLVENDPEKKHNILASFGTFSTGVNLKRLDNVIFAFGGKSEIKVLQSVGRSLRKGNGSDKAVLYDITDDLSSGQYTNYTLDHFRKRIDMYGEQQFKMKIFTVEI